MKEIKRPWDKWKWKHNPKSMGHSETNPKRKIHSNTGIPQETRKISNNLTLHLKELKWVERGKNKDQSGNKRV